MKLIDADEFAKTLYENIRSDNLRIYSEVCNHIKNAPTVDAVEVIRCKDCKYYIPRIKVPTDSGVFTVKICSRISIGITNPEWYCSYGERKGE